MLFRKLIRTFLRYRAQFISMILMIALGLGTFVGFNIEWYSLEQDVKSFLSDTGYADIRIVREKGFSSEDAEAVAALDGVDDVSRFLAVKTDVKDSPDILSLTVTENERISGFAVTSGEPYDPDDDEGLWVSDRYAGANGISVGDALTLTYRNLAIPGTVRGLVKAGEYLICLPDETQLMPDYESYGFAYASPAFLRRTLGAEFYSSLYVRTGLDKKTFAALADEALGETLMILDKDDTVSWAEAMGESEEGKTMAAVLPALFLAIAILTMVTTMHRIASAEKTQIGTLKSLGFKDRTILLHYTSYATVIGLVGTALGLGIGWWLGWFIMNPDGSMGTYLDMPSWALSAPGFTWVVLILTVIGLSLIGFLSVKSMLRGNAADALRPYTPKKMRAILLEKTPLWKVLPFGTKWNLRDCLRHKSRTFMTLFGIIGCMVLIEAGLGMQDVMNEFMDTFYNRAILYDVRVNLDTEHSSPDRVKALAEELDGDTCAQLSVQCEGKSMLVEVYDLRRGLIRFLRSSDDAELALPDDGVLICERIANEMGLVPGDTLRFSPFGTDDAYEVRVKDVARVLSKSVVMSTRYAEAIGLPFTAGVIYTEETDIPENELILNSQTKQSIVDSYDTFMEILLLMVRLLVGAAVLLGIIVLYNLGVMSYTERYREMATLKVIGFKDGKIGRLLIGQNMMLTVIGIVIGIPSGIGVLGYLLHALGGEYELKLAITWVTYALSIALIFGVSLVVSLMIARKNRRIDMVEALKGQD